MHPRLKHVFFPSGDSLIYCCRNNLLEKEIQASSVMLFLVKCCAFDRENNL